LRRVERVILRTLEAEKNLDGALDLYNRALGVYGCEIGAPPRRRRPQLIQAMIDRLRVCFRLGRDAEVANVSASLRSWRRTERRSSAPSSFNRRC
jgi:hypothetical protein